MLWLAIILSNGVNGQEEALQVTQQPAPSQEMPCNAAATSADSKTSVSNLQRELMLSRTELEHLRKENDDLRKAGKTTQRRTANAHDEDDSIPTDELLKRAKGKMWQLLGLPQTMAASVSLRRYSSDKVSYMQISRSGINHHYASRYQCHAVKNRHKLYLAVRSADCHCTLWSTTDCKTWEDVPLPHKFRGFQSLYSHNTELYIIESIEPGQMCFDICQAVQTAESVIVGWSPLVNFPAKDSLSLACAFDNSIIYSTDSLSLKCYKPEKQNITTQSPWPDLPFVLGVKKLQVVVMPEAVHVASAQAARAVASKDVEVVDRWDKQILSMKVADGKPSDLWMTNVTPPMPVKGSLFRALGHLIHVGVTEPHSTSQKVHVLDVTNNCWQKLPSKGQSCCYPKTLYHVNDSSFLTHFCPTVVCFQKQLISFSVQHRRQEQMEGILQYNVDCTPFYLAAEKLDLSP